MICLGEELSTDINKMNLDDLHPKIKEFIGNLSEDNYRTHTVGQTTAYEFKSPKFRVFFWNGFYVSSVYFSFRNKKYLTENQMIRIIDMKAFW